MAAKSRRQNEELAADLARELPELSGVYTTLNRFSPALAAPSRKTGTLLAAMLAGLMIPGCSTAAGLLPVDDSYTVSQRFEAHREEFPEIAWPTLATLAGQSIQFDVPYKDVPGRSLHIDVFSPPEELRNRMAIVLVHGGGWRSGNKSHFYPLANLLAQRGYVVLTPEYRLSVEAPYPAGVQDIEASLNWAKENSSAYGFDADKIAIGGGSSGGQMAALVAYTHQTSLFRKAEQRADPLLALIDLDGVLDFTTPLALEFENRLKDKSAAGLWLGSSFEKNRARWREASPASHVDEHSPPTLIISSGQQRFTAGRQDVLSKLSALGIRNQYIEHDQVLHTFWLFEPYVSRTAESIHAFLTLAASDRAVAQPEPSQ